MPELDSDLDEWERQGTTWGPHPDDTREMRRIARALGAPGHGDGDG